MLTTNQLKELKHNLKLSKGNRSQTSLNKESPRGCIRPFSNIIIHPLHSTQNNTTSNKFSVLIASVLSLIMLLL